MDSKKGFQKRYPNQHAFRLMNPSEFEWIKVISTTDTGVMFYGGQLKSKPEGFTEIQAIRFPKDKYSFEEAKKWIKDHKFEPILEEPALEETKKSIRLEDVTNEEIFKLSNEDLHRLRFRFTQVYSKHFRNTQDITVGKLNKFDILDKYESLTVVAKQRNLVFKNSREIDKDLFKFKMQKRTEKNSEIIVLLKEDNEERIVCGIIYEPDEVDTQGDTANAEEIRKACYSFMENSQKIKIQHQGSRISAAVLENYIAPQEFSIAGRVIKKGTWIMIIRINDNNAWKAIKNGDYTGFSMGGIASFIEKE